MAKYVIETVQTVNRLYYVEVDDVNLAHRAIANGELDEFCSYASPEEIASTTEVDGWQSADIVNANAATYVYDADDQQFHQLVRWDLARKGTTK
jgi:hypothetical protein